MFQVRPVNATAQPSAEANNYQRIRGAIDRTIAEEQARQRTDDSPMSRSGSNSSRQGANTGRRSRPNNGSTDGVEAPPNPDPAVFEAAFVIDDSDEPSRTGTPKPAVPEKDATLSKERMSDDGDKAADRGSEKRTSTEKPNHAATSAATSNATVATRASPTELSPEIKQRLRKLEKLEATYPGMTQCGNGACILLTCCRTFTIISSSPQASNLHRAV